MSASATASATERRPAPEYDRSLPSPGHMPGRLRPKVVDGISVIWRTAAMAAGVGPSLCAGADDGQPAGVPPGQRVGGHAHSAVRISVTAVASTRPATEQCSHSNSMT